MTKCAISFVCSGRGVLLCFPEQERSNWCFFAECFVPSGLDVGVTLQPFVSGHFGLWRRIKRQTSTAVGCCFRHGALGGHVGY